MKGLVLALCLCPVAVMAQETEELPAGYPPQIGTVSGLLDGHVTEWATYDFSVGAFDASAFFTGKKAAPEFRLIGYLPGKPMLNENRLALHGFGPTEAGTLAGAEVKLVGEDIDAPLMSSADQDAEIVLDKVERKNSGYGHATGHFKATICKVAAAPVKPSPDACHPISGTFETDFQYDTY